MNPFDRDKSDTVLLNRRAFIGTAIVLGGLAVSPVQAKPTPTVLFVCQFGSVKSPLARELFRRRAKERGLSVTAISRGITPESHVSPLLAQSLTREAIDIDRDGLHRLDPHVLHTATITVLFDPLPSGWPARRVHDWTDTGSLNQNYEAEKPRLIARIDALLDEIAASKSPKRR